MFILTVSLLALTLAPGVTGIVASSAWILLAILTSTFFLTAYVLLDNRSKNALPATQAVGFTRPVFVSGMVPMKGPNFLRKFEATNSEELAVTRLKALKLMVWATLLFWAWELLSNRGIYGALEFPSLTQSINDSADGAAIGFSMRWLVLTVHFFTDSWWRIYW